MFILASAIGAIAAIGGVTTIRSVVKDGFGRVPTRTM